MSAKILGDATNFLMNFFLMLFVLFFLLRDHDKIISRSAISCHFRVAKKTVY